MKANKPMTSEQLNELMTVAVNMQRDAETDCKRPSAMFAYAVQVAVLELCKVRNDAAALAAENAGLKAALRPSDIPSEWTDAFGDTAVIEHDATGDNQGHSVSWSWVGNQEEVIKSVLLAVDGSIKTPSTDAFLAEVRASAITDALKSLDGVFDTDCVMESNGISYEDAEQRTAGACAVSKALEEFAAQLRKGVQS
ncbi:TPA: hypothetical protein ACW72U_002220 [Enterobacter ludwigii]|nr:hypothetical protein [Enterobacter ludwigii]HDT0810955.1 hypothetical protein [Enterobacter ludwigii]